MKKKKKKLRWFRRTLLRLIAYNSVSKGWAFKNNIESLVVHTCAQLRRICVNIHGSNRGVLVGHAWRYYGPWQRLWYCPWRIIGRFPHTLQWFTRDVPLKTHPSGIVYPLVTHRCCAITHFKAIHLLQWPRITHPSSTSGC